MASNLKVDIVKPTATNGSLSLKGDSGGSATSNGISVDSSGNTSITGTTTIATADINGGTIDGTTIGASSAAAGTFTSVDATSASLDGAVTINESGADVDFRVEASGQANALFVDGTNGNVGLGTNSPAEKIVVSGSGGQRFDFIDTGGATGRISTSGNVIFFGSVTNHPVVLFANNSEAVRIDSSGNVGIGDNTPDVALDVVGDIHYTGSITDVSDRRLKENITNLTDSLNKVAQLEGVSYTLIADRGNEEDTTEFGFIAQNVQELFPEAVKIIQKHVLDEEGNSTEEEINYLGVSYIQLIAPMVEAIKELKAKNEALEARITALESNCGRQ